MGLATRDVRFVISQTGSRASGVGRFGPGRSVPRDMQGLHDTQQLWSAALNRNRFSRNADRLVRLVFATVAVTGSSELCLRPRGVFENQRHAR